MGFRARPGAQTPAAARSSQRGGSSFASGRDRGVQGVLRRGWRWQHGRGQVRPSQVQDLQPKHRGRHDARRRRALCGLLITNRPSASADRLPQSARAHGLLRGALTRACRRQGGRIVVAWLHPQCFLTNTQVSIADSNRGKCKFSKKKIEKGDLRFGWRIGEETWVNCLVDHVHDTVVPAVLGASSPDSESAAPAFCPICRLHIFRRVKR